MYTQLKWHITQIDTGLMSPNMAACYLVESNGEAAIIETGHYKTTERILNLLQQRKIPFAAVKYVIPTHVHLDHAGGASSLMQALPEAKLVIHPRGARHMIDPAKLIAGATAVYGEETFNAIYGEIQPIDEQRMIIPEDNDSLMIGSRTLLFRDTPGHASHHFCIWGEISKGWFTGDTFGISYLGMAGSNGRFLFPTTSPVQFDPEKLKASIKLLMSYKPERAYLTHFGAIDVCQEMANKLCQQVDDFVGLVTAHGSDEVSAESLEPMMTEYLLGVLAEQDCTLDEQDLANLLRLDVKLNSQGLAVWHDRQTQNTP